MQSDKMSNSQPRVNPNVAAAKRRGGARPKSLNTPSFGTPSSLKWVEPLPHPVDIGIAFEQNFEEEYSGFFDLDFNLPSNIASPFKSGLEGIMYRTTGEETLCEKVSTGIEKMSYAKATQKLFSTLDTPTQTALQPVKSFFYNDEEVPDTMVPLMNSIGTINSSLGKLAPRHPATTVKRWACEALTDYDISNEVKGLNADEVYKYDRFVWKDEEGYNIVTEEAKMVEERQRSVVHEISIEINGTNGKIPYVLPPYDPDRYDEVVKLVSVGLDPDIVRKWRRVGLLRVLDKEDWLRGSISDHPPEPAIDLTAHVNELGLQLAPATHSMQMIREQAPIFFSWYRTNCTKVMKRYFKLAAAPTSPWGYPSQLVQSDGMTAKAPIPVSDADIVTGFILNNNANLVHRPSVIAYTKKHKLLATSINAEKALKDIAH